MIFDYDEDMACMLFQNVQALYQLGAAGGYPNLSAASMAAAGIPVSGTPQLPPHYMTATSSAQMGKLTLLSESLVID